MRQTGYENELRQILGNAQHGPMNPAAAGEQVRLILENRKFNDALALIEAIRARNEDAVAHAAAMSFLDVTAARQEPKWLDAFGNRFPGWAIEDTEIWGMTGYVRVIVRQFHNCVSSMSDWANRKGVRPWMLLNLSLAYRNIDRDESAANVNEFALQLPDDHTSDEHRVWVAMDEALAGKFDRADKRISAIPMENLNTVHQLIARIVWALVVASRARAKGTKWRAATSEQLHLVVDAKRAGQVVPIVAKYFRKAVRKLREDFVKGLFETLWCWQIRSQI
jgi:hypothetical protein